MCTYYLYTSYIYIKHIYHIYMMYVYHIHTPAKASLHMEFTSKPQEKDNFLHVEILMKHPPHDC